MDNQIISEWWYNNNKNNFVKIIYSNVTENTYGYTKKIIHIFFNNLWE